MIYIIGAIVIIAIWGLISWRFDLANKTKPKKKSNKKPTLEEFENDFLHLHAEGYLLSSASVEEVIKYADEQYTKLYSSQ